MSKNIFSVRPFGKLGRAYRLNRQSYIGYCVCVLMIILAMIVVSEIETFDEPLPHSLFYLVLLAFPVAGGCALLAIASHGHVLQSPNARTDQPKRMSVSRMRFVFLLAVFNGTVAILAASWLVWELIRHDRTSLDPAVLSVTAGLGAYLCYRKLTAVD